MRKLLIIVISVIIVTAGLFLAFYNKEKLEYISIYSIKEDYQRVITSDEELSVILYLSEYDSFLTDTNYIENTQLNSALDEIEVTVSQIRYLNYTETYQDVLYYAYSFDLSFENIQVMNYQMNLIDCFLDIRYLNQNTINIELGNMYLLFQEIQDESYISIERMYAIYNESDFEYISGIYLVIDNFAQIDIEIIDIYTNNPNLQLDLNNTIELSEPPSYNLGISEHLNKPYSSIGVITNTEPINPTRNSNYLIPVKYKDIILKINRFPIMIDYKFNNQVFTHIIDDTIYHSKQLTLGENYGLAREYIYYY